MHKRCPRCQTDKLLGEYWKARSRKAGLTIWCKDCIRSYRRSLRRRRQERPNIDYPLSKKCLGCCKELPSKEFAQGRGEPTGLQPYCRSCTSIRRKRRTYGSVLPESIVCEICLKGGSLHVDHDHKTGLVRGHLCPSCNHGLGMFKDDHSLLKRAIVYLQRSRTGIPGNA